MSDSSLADGKAGVDANLDGPAKRRQIRNIVERKRKEKIKHYINAIAKLLPTDRLEHKERNSTNAILEAAWRYMVDLREQNDRLLLERGTDVHNEEISRLKCLLSEAREDRDRMERMLQHCASVPAGFDPLTQWHKQGSSASGSGDGPAVADRASNARSSTAQDKLVSEPLNSAAGAALSKGTLLAAANAGGALLPTVAAGGLCNGASISAAASAAASGGKPLCIPPNLGQGVIITQSGQAIFLNEQGVAVAQGLIGGALPSLPGLVSRPDEAAAVRGGDGASSIGSRSIALDGELSASGASSLDSSAAAGSTSPAPAGAAADGQAQASRPGACRLQPPGPSAGVAAAQSALASGAAAAGAAMSAVNAQPLVSGLASATRFAGPGAGTALALHQQSGGLVAMAAGQATGGIVAVPGQPGQLPSAFLLPNGQIIPVVTQPQGLQPVAPAQLAAAAAAVPLAADVLASSCKAASVSSSTPPLLFTTASGSAAVTTTVTTGTVTTSRAASVFQHSAATLTTAAATPAGSAAAGGGAAAGAMTAGSGGSLMYVALPPAMSLQPPSHQQPPAPQQQPSLSSTACSAQQQQAAVTSGGAPLLLDAGCFSGPGAEHLKAAAAVAAAGGQRLIMPKPANFAGSAVQQQQPPPPQPLLPPQPTTTSAEGGSSAKSKRKAKKAPGSGGGAAAMAAAAAIAAGAPGVPIGNAASQHADLDTDILAKAAESIFSDGGGSGSAAHFGATDDNPLQIDMDNSEHDADIAAAATMPPEAAGTHATSHAPPAGVERWPQELQPEELALGIGSCARSGTDRTATSASKQPGGSQGEARDGAGLAPATGGGGSRQPSDAASRRGAGGGSCAAAVAATSSAAAAPGSLQKAKAAAAATASGIVDAKLAYAGATGSEATAAVAAAAATTSPASSAKKPSAAKRSRADPDARAPVAGSKSDAGRSTGGSAEQHPKRKRKPSSGNTTPSLAVQPLPASAAHQQPVPFYEAAGVAACAGETADGPDIPESIQFSEDDLDLVLDQVENLDAAPALTATIGSTAAASAAVSAAASTAIASKGCPARPYSGLPQPTSTAKRSLGSEACLAAVDAEIGPVFSLGRPPSTSAGRESSGSDRSATVTRTGREAARTPSAAVAAETAVVRAAEMTDRPGQRLSDGTAAAGVPPPRAAAEQPKRNRDGSSSRAPMAAAATTASSADPTCGTAAVHLRREDQVSGSLPSHLLSAPPVAAVASPRLSGNQAPAPAAAMSVPPSSSTKSTIAQEESSYFYSSSPNAAAAGAAAGPPYDGRHYRKASPAATAAASDGASAAAVERPPSLSSGGTSAAPSYSATAASSSFASSFYSSGGGGLAHAPSKHSGELHYSPSQLSCRASSGAAADPSSTPSAPGKQHLFAVPFPPSPKEALQQQQPQQRLHHPGAGVGSASQHAPLQLQRQPSDIGRGGYLNDSSAGQSAPAARHTGTPDGPAVHVRHAGLSDATRDSRKSRPNSSTSEEQSVAASAVASAMNASTPPGSGARLGDVRTAAGTLQDAPNGGAAPVSPYGSREFVPSAVPSSDPFKAAATAGNMRSSGCDAGSVSNASAELLYGGGGGRNGTASGSALAPPPPRNGSLGGGGSGRDVDFSAEALLSPSYPLARFASTGTHMPVCTAAGTAATMFLPSGAAVGDFHVGPKAHGHSMAAYDLLHATSQRQASIPSSAAGQGFSAVLSKQMGVHVSSSGGVTTAYGGKDGITSMASGAVPGKETAPFNVNFFSASGSDYGGGDGGRSSVGGGGGGGAAAAAPGARCSAPASALSPFMPYGTAGSAMGDAARLSETGFTFSLTPTTNSSATAAAAAAAAVAANQAAAFGSQLAHRQFFFSMPDSLLHHHSRSDDLFRPSAAAAAAYQQHQLVHSPNDKSTQQSSPTSLPKSQQQQRATAVDLGGGGGAKLSHSAVNLYSSSFDSLMQPQHDFGQQQQQVHHHQQHHQQQHQQQSQQHHLQQQQHRRYDERDMQGISVGMYDMARTAAAPPSPAGGSGSGQQSSDKSRGGKAASAKQQHDKPHHAQKKQRYEATEPYDLAASTSRAGSACVSASPSSMSSSSPSPLFHGASPSLLSRQDMSAYVPFPHPIGTIRTEASSLPTPQSVAARSAGTAPADLFGSLYGAPARPSTAASGLGLPFAAAAAAFSSVRPPVAASPSSSMSAGSSLVPPVHPSTAGLPMHSQFNLSNLFGEAMVGSQAGALRGFPHGLLPPPPPPSQDGSSLYAARSAMLPHSAMSLNSLLGHHGHVLDPGGSSGGGGIPGGSGHALGPSMPSFASHPHPMMGFGLPAPSLNFTMPDH